MFLIVTAPISKKIFFYPATATATKKAGKAGNIIKSRGNATQAPASPCKAFFTIGRYMARVKNAAILAAFLTV